MKIQNCLYVFVFLMNSVFSFINIKFGSCFRINQHEINKKIDYDISKNNQDIINNISGFYGLIGPSSQSKKIKNLMELFNHNGIIQGVFFDKGQLSFVKHFVRTDKLRYEEENGVIPMKLYNILFFKLFEFFGLTPNIFGLANTAMIQFNNTIYALHELDQPYEININFDEFTLSTNKKIHMVFLHNFLAHSKIKNDIIETIDYDIWMPKVRYIETNDNFTKINEIRINTRYVSMIHDFVSLNESLIFLDAPILFDISKIMYDTIPVTFFKNYQTRFCIVNKKTKNIKFINTENMYILHYARSFENDDEIVIYACVYDYFDFGTPYSNYGKFRKIIINKNDDTIKYEKNPLFEKMALEFPIVYKNYTIMICSQDNEANRLIIAKDFQFYKEMELKKTIYGEPSIVEIKNKPYIMCFCYKNIKNYIVIIDLENTNTIEIEIPYNMSLGFHSIFVQKPIS